VTPGQTLGTLYNIPRRFNKTKQHAPGLLGKIVRTEPVVILWACRYPWQMPLKQTPYASTGTSEFAPRTASHYVATSTAPRTRTRSLDAQHTRLKLFYTYNGQKPVQNGQVNPSQGK
jgi:hypothetical protein